MWRTTESIVQSSILLTTEPTHELKTFCHQTKIVCAAYRLHRNIYGSEGSPIHLVNRQHNIIYFIVNIFEKLTMAILPGDAQDTCKYPQCEGYLGHQNILLHISIFLKLVLRLLNLVLPIHIIQSCSLQGKSLHFLPSYIHTEKNL